VFACRARKEWLRAAHSGVRYCAVTIPRSMRGVDTWAGEGWALLLAGVSEAQAGKRIGLPAQPARV